MTSSRSGDGEIYTLRYRAGQPGVSSSSSSSKAESTGGRGVPILHVSRSAACNAQLPNAATVQAQSVAHVTSHTLRHFMITQHA
jgi:hypothetical protein